MSVNTYRPILPQQDYLRDLQRQQDLLREAQYQRIRMTAGTYTRYHTGTFYDEGEDEGRGKRQKLLLIEGGL
jgi:hypothetical protein